MKAQNQARMIQFFKDDATAFNKKKHDVVDGKGVLNNRISEYIFSHLNRIGIPTHFIKRINMREQLIKEVEIIPLEIVVRNVAAGSLAKRLGIEEGTVLPRSIIEFYYKADALDDPMVSEEHVTAFGWASPQEIDDIMALAIRVNDFLTGLFLGVGIQLVDFKIECGRLFEGDMMRIVVADEISPDSCRLWDVNTNQKLDKDVFRRDLGNLVEAYQEVARRLGIMNENEPNPAPSRADQQASGAGSMIKARVTVTLKNGVLDPQGKAIEHALGGLGFSGVDSVRQGKVFDVVLETSDRAKAEAELKAMGEKLLANTVIEDFAVEVL